MYKELGAAVAADPVLKSRVVVAKARDRGSTAARRVEPAAHTPRFAQVDADAHRSIGERFGVQGFPTISACTRPGTWLRCLCSSQPLRLLTSLPLTC